MSTNALKTFTVAVLMPCATTPKERTTALVDQDTMAMDATVQVHVVNLTTGC